MTAGEDEGKPKVDLSEERLDAEPGCDTKIGTERDGSRVTLTIQAKPPFTRSSILLAAFLLGLFAYLLILPSTGGCGPSTAQPARLDDATPRSKDAVAEDGGHEWLASYRWLMWLTISLLCYGVGELGLRDWRTTSFVVDRERLRAASRRGLSITLSNLKVDVELISIPTEPNRFAVVLSGDGTRQEILVTGGSEREANAVATRIKRIVAAAMSQGAYRSPPS
jgi:hypothetical protein